MPRESCASKWLGSAASMDFSLAMAASKLPVLKSNMASSYGSGNDISESRVPCLSHESGVDARAKQGSVFLIRSDQHFEKRLKRFFAERAGRELVCGRVAGGGGT